MLLYKYMHVHKYVHIYKILYVLNYCSDKLDLCSETVFMIGLKNCLVSVLNNVVWNKGNREKKELIGWFFQASVYAFIHLHKYYAAFMFRSF